MKINRLLVLFAVGLLIASHEATPSRAAESPAGGAASDITPTEEPAAGPWGWLKMPTITMPKITMPKMPADPLAPIKTSARKVGDGTKKAWEGTKEIFTFGGSKSAEPAGPAERVASKGESPSLWSRMFGEKQAEPAEGPATVGEWMSQSRVE